MWHQKHSQFTENAENIRNSYLLGFLIKVNKTWRFFDITRPKWNEIMVTLFCVVNSYTNCYYFLLLGFLRRYFEVREWPKAIFKWCLASPLKDFSKTIFSIWAYIFGYFSVWPFSNFETSSRNQFLFSIWWIIHFTVLYFLNFLK